MSVTRVYFPSMVTRRADKEVMLFLVLLSLVSASPWLRPVASPWCTRVENMIHDVLDDCKLVKEKWNEKVCGSSPVCVSPLPGMRELEDSRSLLYWFCTTARETNQKPLNKLIYNACNCYVDEAAQCDTFGKTPNLPGAFCKAARNRMDDFPYVGESWVDVDLTSVLTHKEDCIQ